MKTRLFPFVLVSILTVALIAVYLGRTRPASTAAAPAAEPSEPAQVEARTPEPRATPTPSNRFSTYHWQPGDHASWQFGVSVRMAPEAEKIGEGSETRLGGKLQLAVLTADAQRVTLAAAVSDAWFDTDGRRNHRYEELFNGTPAILTLSPSGNLLEMAFPRHIPDDDRKFLRFVYGWEFVARQAAAYEEQDHASDGDGSIVRASYRRRDDVHIHKTRQSQQATVEAGEAMQNVVMSEFTGMVGKVWVGEMSGWEDTVMYVNGNVFAASRIAVSFKVETNSPAMAPALFTLLSTPAARSAFGRNPDPLLSAQTESVSHAVRREALAARWEKVPFDQVVDSIQTMAGGSMQQLAKPLQDLEDWLTVHPDDGPVRLLQSLQSLPTDQTTMSALLINGLAEADTLQSREALAAILDATESFPPTTAIQAAVAVGDLGEKTPPALKETLARLMDSSLSDGSYQMSDTALFAFARIAKDDTAAQEYLVQRVAPWLEANADADQTVKALSALANAAADQPSLLERAAGLARSSDADIRLAAVDYLGSLPNSVAGRAIVDQLVSDPDEQVQAAIDRLRAEQQPAVNP